MWHEAVVAETVTPDWRRTDVEARLRRVPAGLRGRERKYFFSRWAMTIGSTYGKTETGPPASRENKIATLNGMTR